MPKSSREQIKKDEKKVLQQLAADSSKSIDKIAKTCKFSRQKVWRIMKRLEQNNTIWGYTAAIDHEKQHQQSYIILIKKTTKPIGDIIEKIVNRDMEKKAEEMNVHISSSRYLNGCYDWIICFAADNIKQAKKFSNLIATFYPENIAEIHLLEDIFTVKKQGVTNPEIHKLQDFKLPK